MFSIANCSGKICMGGKSKYIDSTFSMVLKKYQMVYNEFVPLFIEEDIE
jgi:hypothetical protein